MRPLKISCMLLAALAVAGLAAAQTYIAYPMDNLHGVRGQIIPLAAAGSTSFDETRTQHLIPAPYLPSAGGYIIGLEVSPHVTGAVPYKQLVISLGHTTAGALTTVFGNNLPSKAVVLAIKNWTVNYPSRTKWVPINFNTPFRYDGKSNLIIEVQKMIDRTASPRTVSHQTVYRPSRTDIPKPLFAYGAGGSGKFNAVSGSLFPTTSHIMWRLRYRNTHTLTISSTRSSSAKDFFHLGATVTLTAQGTASEVFFDVIDLRLRPSPLPVPGVNGWFWPQTFFNLIAIGVIPASGRGDFSIVIPNVPALVGTHVYFQSAVAGARIDLTNVVDCIIAA